MNTESIRLTQYSHGAGCGCKIAPDVLSQILARHEGAVEPDFPSLLVGHASRDDAAAVVLDDDRALLSTTDFFMPIVDDPYDFGRIAATNAISDIFAMGGTPLVAVAILGWPLESLGPEVANRVVQGGRDVCHSLGFPLAGGHSIDAPEPIFGLAVTGVAPRATLKRNNTARPGDLLLLTKPLGIGILTTAEKRGKLQASHIGLATNVMCQANSVGAELAQTEGVNALTDVTGFGLAGHLSEICAGAGLDATIDMDKLPLLPGLDEYIAMGCVPGGTLRNYEAYKQVLPDLSERNRAILCDPQTSGGLLVTVDPKHVQTLQRLLESRSLPHAVIGSLQTAAEALPRISVQQS